MSHSVVVIVVLMVIMVNDTHHPPVKLYFFPSNFLPKLRKWSYLQKSQFGQCPNIHVFLGQGFPERHEKYFWNWTFTHSHRHFQKSSIAHSEEEEKIVFPPSDAETEKFQNIKSATQKGLCNLFRLTSFKKKVLQVQYWHQKDRFACRNSKKHRSTISSPRHPPWLAFFGGNYFDPLQGCFWAILTPKSKHFGSGCSEKHGIIIESQTRSSIHFSLRYTNMDYNIIYRALEQQHFIDKSFGISSSARWKKL